MNPDPAVRRCGIRVSAVFEGLRLCGKPASAAVVGTDDRLILYLCPEHRPGWTPGGYTKIQELSP
jgi:hypothetical protein